MTLDELWKKPFQSPNTNKAVAQTAFAIIKSVVRTCEDYKVFSEGSVERFEAQITFGEFSDIAALPNIVRHDFSPYFDTGIQRRPTRLPVLLRYCQEQAQDLGVAHEIKSRLHYRNFRIKEFCQTLETLFIFRNYASHDTQERNDIGLCLKVSGSLLRYVELLDLGPNWKNEVELLRQSALHIVKTVYETDPTNELHDHELEFHGSSERVPAEEDLTQAINGKVDQIVGEIAELKQQLLRSISGQTPLAFQDPLLGLDEDSTVKQFDDFHDDPEPITLAQLRQRLMQLRKTIAEEFRLNSDSENILSEKIIDDLLLLGIQDLRGWRSLDTTTFLQTKHKKQAHEQIERHWETIESLLSSYDCQNL